MKRDNNRQIEVVRGEPGCPTPTKNGYATRADAKRAIKRLRAKNSGPMSAFGRKFAPTRDLAAQMQTWQ